MLLYFSEKESKFTMLLSLFNLRSILVVNSQRMSQRQSLGLAEEISS